MLHDAAFRCQPFNAVHERLMLDKPYKLQKPQQQWDLLNILQCFFYFLLLKEASKTNQKLGMLIFDVF